MRRTQSIRPGRPGFAVNPMLRGLLLPLLLCLMAAGEVAGQDRYRMQREQMVRDALESDGIVNKRVLSAMRTVPRHEFVSGLHRARAYQDTSLPIGASQTISPPFVVAYMTQVLDPQPEDRVLEIGTGSGYQAAVLAEIVKEVYTVEIVSSLAQSATRRLEKLGYSNVHVRDGDGYQGWAEHAPFDRIIVTCSPEQIPTPLIDQLREGGRMIIPVGERYQQAFVLLTRHDGELKEEKLIPTLFVPMTGESEELRRVQPDPDNPEVVNGSFERDDNEDGNADGWHYQRQAAMEDGDPMDGNWFLRFRNTEPGTGAQALQGTAVNGRRIGALQLRYWVRWDSVIPGPSKADQAGLIVHCYDQNRKEIHVSAHGGWRGSLGWQRATTDVVVPPQTREIIVRIGLNGATGTLDFDQLQMTAIPR